MAPLKLYNQLSQETKRTLSSEDKNTIEALLQLDENCIDLGKNRVNDDYDEGDRLRIERLVLKPFYRVSWDSENSSGSTDIRLADSFIEAIELAQDAQDFHDNDSYFNMVDLDLKEVWIDADNDVVEETGDDESWSDYAYRNKSNALVQQIGLDWNYIKNFGGAEDTADDLKIKVETEIFNDIEGNYTRSDGQKFSVQAVKRGNWGAGKYNTLKVEVPYKNESVQVGYIELRIADHSYNPRNVTADYFFSITIANRDATSGRFYGNHNLSFDGDADYDDIVSEAKSKIEDLVDKMDRDEPLEERVAENYIESDKTLENQLRTEIRTQLGSHECKKLKNLHAILDTKESRELAMEYIYIQAATYGVSVQTAMSTYDSSLGE